MKNLHRLKMRVVSYKGGQQFIGLKVHGLEVLDGFEALDSLGMFDGLEVFNGFEVCDGDNVRVDNNVLGVSYIEVCDPLLPNGLADP